MVHAFQDNLLAILYNWELLLMVCSSVGKCSLSTAGLSNVDPHCDLSHFKANWNQPAYVSKYLHILPTIWLLTNGEDI